MGKTKKSEWNLKPPKRARYPKYDGFLMNNKSDLNILKDISSHAFNKIISIVIPNGNVVIKNPIPKSIENLFESSSAAVNDYYLVKNLQLSEFINRYFIEAFIRRGNLYALSVHQSETDPSADGLFIGISPSGILYLIVDKLIYQTLGLEGKLCKLSCEKEQHYLIKINFNDRLMIDTNSKFYQRIKLALSKAILPKCTFRLNWIPPIINNDEQIDYCTTTAPTTESICPSTIAKYFNDKGYEVELIKCEFKSHSESMTCKIPTLQEFVDDGDNSNSSSSSNSNDDDDGDDDKDFCTPNELFEFLGYLNLSCSLDLIETENEQTKKYINSMVNANLSKLDNNNCNEINNTTTTNKIFQFKGFISCEMIQQLFKLLKQFIDKKSSIGELPWISIYCHGFQESPITFNNAVTSRIVADSYCIFLTSTADKNFIFKQF